MRNNPMVAGGLRDIDSDGSVYRGAVYLRYAVRLALSLVVAVPQMTAAQQSGAAESTPSADRLEEVVVTARKQTETLLDVPVAITAFSEASLEKYDIRSFTDYATKVPNLSFSYGTANYGYVDSHTVAIRGISGAGTTGVYIDETPVPDSLDPRILDIARIEVLKGPQGTLFGQSSLGGNLRMITVQPSETDPDVHYSARMGGTSGAGSPDYSVDFAGTQKLIDGVLYVRAVGFYDHEGGFLHRVATDPSTGDVLANVNNYGAQKSYGGSLSFRWIANDRTDVTLRMMAQDSESDGWSAPYAPLPSFSIASLTMNRTDNVQERANDRFYLPALNVEYRGDGYSLHESLSYFDRHATQIEDGSEGTRDALSADWSAVYPGINAIYADNQAFPWTGDTSYRRTVSETRLSFNKTSFGLSGTTGIYLSRSMTGSVFDGGNLPLIQQLGLNTNAAVTANSGTAPPTPTSYCRSSVTDTSCPTYGSGLVWYSYQPSYHNDEAAFGELYYDLGQFELTAGGRYYKQRQTGYEDNAGALNFSYLNIQVPETKQSGFTPKLALSYKINPTTMVYGSYSQGFRAGGAGVPLPLGPSAFLSAIHATINQPTTYTSDKVVNYEVGGKMEALNGRLIVTGALFQMNWTNIQQTIIAPQSYITLIANAGDARVRGGELEATAKATDYLDLHAGLGVEDAVITNGVLYWQPTGSRVYNVPKVTANASATFTVPITGALSSFYMVDGSYVGNSVSGTAGCQLNVGRGGLAEYPASSYPNGYQFFPCPPVSPTNLQGIAPTRASYSVVNARLGLNWGKSQLSLYANNLTNIHPNLGDFNPESYATHDPQTGYIIPRVATLRPFNTGLQFRQKF
jgi:outer membrane receptor protein involved in Fe transport